MFSTLIPKLKSMTIEVTGCHDCPFAEYDYERSLKYWCEHFANKGHVFDINYYVKQSECHPSCPLQTESITIKKKDNEPNTN